VDECQPLPAPPRVRESSIAATPRSMVIYIYNKRSNRDWTSLHGLSIILRVNAHTGNARSKQRRRRNFNDTRLLVLNSPPTAWSSSKASPEDPYPAALSPSTSSESWNEAAPGVKPVVKSPGPAYAPGVKPQPTFKPAGGGGGVMPVVKKPAVKPAGV